MQKPTECPCCGQTIAAMPPELLARVVSDKCAEIVTLLAKRAGTFVPCVEVIAWAYRHDPDGGPMNAAACVNQIIGYNRPKLRAMGWNIEGRQGPYGGYRLVVSDATKEATDAAP